MLDAADEIEKLQSALERIRDHDKIILGEHMDEVRANSTGGAGMKPTTEQLINDLRNHTLTSMAEAANRLQELSKLLKSVQLDCERYQRELFDLKTWNQNNRPDWVKKDPSRLEIAAMLKAGWFANAETDFSSTDYAWWIEQAQKLMKADKEVAQ